MRDTLYIPLRPWPTLAAVAMLALLPVVAIAVGQPFYVVFATRVLIYALIASSLNLLIGYVGLVSFGHAAFVGAGAYTVAVLMSAGIVSAWLLWPAAIVVAALLALLIGAISLRTRGVYFIMITLAFAQMVYYLVVSLRVLGSDDGLTLDTRPSLGFLALDRDTNFYSVMLAILLAALLAMRALLNAPLGRALQGIRDNETRMEAIGFPTYRLKLLAFVIAGAAAGLGGGLLASLNGLVGPNLLHWPESGVLMIMVILGGAGRLLGGILGAAALLIVQEAIAGQTIHWPLAIGVVLLAVVLFAPQGLSGLMRRGDAAP
ncbi:MAG: branched-chain amino acid ABC transporter permease [Reyranella sp.]|uniref:branched-chain amino acid ABC transporter permease n=1 Tax=Reyranella sp. TaxID=1929291 RepID=UPI003D0FB806